MWEWINERELKIFEIYAMALRLFRSNFKKIAFVVAIVFIPIAILHTIIMQQLFATSDSMRALSQISGIETTEFIEMAVAYGGNQLLQIMVLLWLEPVGIIAISKITKSALVEGDISAKEALGEGLNCIGKYMLAGVFVALIVGLGFCLLVIPGVILGVMVLFYLQSIGLSEQKGRLSLQYSAALVKGRWFKTLGFVLFTVFISLGFNSLLDLLTFWVGDGLLGNCVYMALSYFTESLVVICTTVLFLNREMLVHGKKLQLASKEEIVMDVI